MRCGRRTIEHLNCGALLATLPFMRFRVSSFLGRLSLVTVGIVLAASNAAADEGQWTPDQISQLDFEMMKARGLDLSAQQLWDPDGDERSGGQFGEPPSTRRPPARSRGRRGRLGERRGRRWSAARAYFHPVKHRPNLEIRYRALATRVLFEGKRAVGVEYLRGRRTRRVRARRG